MIEITIDVVDEYEKVIEKPTVGIVPSRVDSTPKLAVGNQIFEEKKLFWRARAGWFTRSHETVLGCIYGECISITWLWCCRY